MLGGLKHVTSVYLKLSVSALHFPLPLHNNVNPVLQTILVMEVNQSRRVLVIGAPDAGALEVVKGLHSFLSLLHL